MSDTTIGKVIGIALRTAVRGQMREVSEAQAIEKGGLVGDVKSSEARGVTFLSSRQWEQVQRELGVPLPWHTRRANVLVETDGLAHLVGRTIELGQVQVEIKAETRPCELMDTLHDGLRRALTPDLRGGVYGKVIRAGQFRVGDMVRVASQ
jgi:MOSC domain-containing protein YiiM